MVSCWIGHTVNQSNEFLLDNGNFICAFCGVTISQRKNDWLDHVHTFHLRDFQRLSDERRVKRREEREERMKSERVLDEAIAKMDQEVR